MLMHIPLFVFKTHSECKQLPLGNNTKLHGVILVELTKLGKGGNRNLPANSAAGKISYGNRVFNTAIAGILQSIKPSKMDCMS
jgi:hypothetical protein